MSDYIIVLDPLLDPFLKIIKIWQHSNLLLRKVKVNKKGLTIIRLQYCHGRDKIELSTGEKIEPKYWDKSKGQPKSKHPEWAYLDEQLNKFSQRMKSIVRDAKLKDIEPSICRTIGYKSYDQR